VSRILALDHGQVRTGVAVSDESGTLATPLGVIEHVESKPGREALLRLIAEQRPARIVVGLPVSLDGREHAQAGRARAFARRLAASIDIPVDLYDERYTSALADRRGGRASRDARAAATLLEDYLRTMSDE
jgi:putative holliday junction resolvase